MGIQPAQDPYMTTEEVAALMRVPESTVRYWRHIGEGPASFRIRRRVFYRHEDVISWVEAMRMADPSAQTA